jgi:hypothetical protein
VRLWPPDPLEEVIAGAFNAHQRRLTGGGALLGPDAAAAAAREFTGLGRDVVRRVSSWRLGPASPALTRAWFSGWLAAACERVPSLTTETDNYARQRLAEAAAGELRVSVQHQDLLVPAAGLRGP